jgi:tRNA pseudouridine38-40 synthase
MKERPSKIVALWCWYHGGAFRGYQSQLVGPTVQDTLTAAFRRAGFSRNPVSAGRTDLGVHARMQVLSFREVEGVPTEGIAARLNAELPKDVGICVAREAPRKFHPQWQASTKEYRYRLGLGPHAWAIDVELDRLRALLSAAVGTHDFFAFHEKSSKRMPRTVRSIEVTPGGEVRIVGDGFARYMVRYLVGSAVAAARREVASDDFFLGLREAISFRGVRAPAHGLILWEVRYPPAMDPFAADRAAPAGLPDVEPFASQR